jgi:hypothetical protein
VRRRDKTRQGGNDTTAGGAEFNSFLTFRKRARDRPCARSASRGPFQDPFQRPRRPPVAVHRSLWSSSAATWSSWPPLPVFAFRPSLVRRGGLLNHLFPLLFCHPPVRPAVSLSGCFSPPSLSPGNSQIIKTMSSNGGFRSTAREWKNKPANQNEKKPRRGTPTLACLGMFWRGPPGLEWSRTMHVGRS